MSTYATDPAGIPTIETARWRIDPARSSVEFHVKNLWGLFTVRGRFSRYHGALDLSGKPAVDLTIDADSLDTGNEKRDAHLRSDDFFHSDRHPYVRFVSESVTLDGEQLHVAGELHARGARVALEVDAMVRNVDDELEVEATTTVDHRRLGMTWNVMRMIGRRSELMVKGRLVRDAM